MIEIISGEKGKGKTKELLEKVNNTVSTDFVFVVFFVFCLFFLFE